MLKTLYIEATQSEPEVVLDYTNSYFSIKGDILPEDSIAFFSPIFNWFNSYALNPYKKTVVEFDISIINTSSTRRLVTLFKILEKIASNGNQVVIKWIYLTDDEIMEYAAYEFSSVFNNLRFIKHAK